jgi:phosphoglycolate phosphatase
MAVKGILLDKDGTLIDVTGTWVPAYREILGELFGSDRVEELLVAAGYDAATGTFKPGSILAGGTTRQLVDVWWPGLAPMAALEKLRLLDVDYRELSLRHLKSLMPLEPVLSGLRSAGYRLGVATNDTRASATSHLQRLGVASLFDIIVGADTVSAPKPSGHMVMAFSKAVGLEPSGVAMVGDNLHDMEEARNGKAGLAIGVLSGNSAHADLAPLADHVIADIAQLGPLLRDLS